MMRLLPFVILFTTLLSCGRTGLVTHDPGPPDMGADVYWADGDVAIHFELCGDGVVQSDFEECDDGNHEDGDGCSSDCLLIGDDLCSPCVVDLDCGGADDACLELLDGVFCGEGCGPEGSCPDGARCIEDAQTGPQCVPIYDVCAGCLDNDGDGSGIGEECLAVDCDDEDAEVHPFADEWCDGIDNNCDGVIDEATALDALLWYRDADGDGYGNPDVTPFACSVPAGYVDNPDDCNDAQAAINPGAIEICDDIDNNCNDENDEGCPPDLIIDAETVEMSGEFLFDRVEILNGGVLRVTPFDGTPSQPDTGTEGTGCISLTARIVLIRANSGIDADSSGGAGLGIGQTTGVGPGLINNGPGGGGYGGRGGSGELTEGGLVYGDEQSATIEQGSNGGGYEVAIALGNACSDLQGLDTPIAIGGGCVVLDTPALDVVGYIDANGGIGNHGVDGSTPARVDGSGGGSGGGILIRAPRITGGGRISANGGHGGRGGTYERGGIDGTCIGNGAGGGGGGRIKFFGGTPASLGSVSVSGGSGAEGPQANATSGDDGSIFVQP